MSFDFSSFLVLVFISFFSRLYWWSRLCYSVASVCLSSSVLCNVMYRS